MRRHWRTLILLSSISLPLFGDSGSIAYKNGDYATALKEWQTSADNGVEEAQYNLGLLYSRGFGVGQDYAKAAEYYRKAAEQGNVNAEYNLAVLYSSGQGVSKNPDEAEKWFRKAADAGDVNAAHGLGDLYYDNKKYDEARQWYQIAADAGVADAEFGLGLMYDLGQGFPQDHARALQYYQQAAEQGSASALTNMAVLYYNGEGVPANREIAHRYFVIASRMGEERAKNLIQMTAEKLKANQIAQAEAEATQWMQAHPAKFEPAPVPMRAAPSKRGKPASSVSIRTTSSSGTPQTD
jgi:hypothetical protein